VRGKFVSCESSISLLPRRQRLRLFGYTTCQTAQKS
jgi:hypothetical protein